MRTLELTDTTIKTQVATTIVGGARSGPELVRLSASLWRVTRFTGEILGHIEALAAEGGTRYRAKRFHHRQRRFLTDGEFWDMNDAIACFRSR